MTQRSAAILAWGVAGFAYLITFLTITLAITNGPALHNTDLVGALLQAVVASCAITVVGGLIASRRSRNPIGWLLLFGATATAIQGFATQYVVHTMAVDRGSLPAVEWVAWLGSTFGGLVYPGVVVLILLLFPDGRLPSPRWRLIAWLDIALAVANDAIGLLDPAPLQSPGAPSVANPLLLAHIKGLEQGPVGYVIYLAGLIVVVAAATSLVVRLRRATGVEARAGPVGRLRAGHDGPRVLHVHRDRPARARPPEQHCFQRHRDRGIRHRPPRGDRRRDVAVPPLRHRHRHQSNAGLRRAGGVHHSRVRRHRSRHRRADRWWWKAQSLVVGFRHRHRGFGFPTGA